jgi:hypothetical protein
MIGSKSGERFANGLTSYVSWQVLPDDRLVRSETLEAQEDVVHKEMACCGAVDRVPGCAAMKVQRSRSSVAKANSGSPSGSRQAEV